MQIPIRVPLPCNESWADMAAGQDGRHCMQCSKTVVDFTSWNTDDIIAYLEMHKGTCGRFLTSQLQEPPAQVPETALVQKIAESRLPFLRKAAAVILLAFSTWISSCQPSDKVPEDKTIVSPSSGNIKSTDEHIKEQTNDTISSVAPSAPPVRPEKKTKKKRVHEVTIQSSEAGFIMGIPEGSQPVIAPYKSDTMKSPVYPQQEGNQGSMDIH